MPAAMTRAGSQHAEVGGLEQDLAEGHVHGQLAHAAAFGGEPRVRARPVDGAQFVQLAEGAFEGRGGGRIGKGKGLHVQPQGQQVQGHVGQVAAQHLGLGELDALVEIGFRVQAHAGAGLDAPRAAGPLARAGLGDPLDGQALDARSAAW